MIQWSYFPTTRLEIFTDDEASLYAGLAKDIRRWLSGPNHDMPLDQEAPGGVRYRWEPVIFHTGAAPGQHVRRFRAMLDRRLSLQILGPEIDAGGHVVAPAPCVTVMESQFIKPH